MDGKHLVPDFTRRVLGKHRVLAWGGHGRGWVRGSRQLAVMGNLVTISILELSRSCMP